MVAVTYGVARVPASNNAERDRAAASRKGWFGRFFDALAESRMQQAYREIRMHSHLFPYSLDERGQRLAKTDRGEMPFSGR